MSNNEVINLKTVVVLRWFCVITARAFSEPSYVTPPSPVMFSLLVSIIYMIITH